jgi:asparagine synthase (glutamine-hydrolysing)
MCGINGILNFNQTKVDQNQLLKMRDALEHRGPDDAGFFLEDNIGLGHRRLSIIDTSAAGHQPFISENKRYILVFNGEIYNYKSFYTEIRNKGLVIKTGSDTEVLMLLFELYGMNFLKRLHGMFAFAIWDTQAKKLILARDRMGVKPLYYAFYNNAIYFASEQKALFTAGVPLEISENGLDEYFFNRFVAGENTLYNRVKKLLPGHYMVLENDGYTTYQKWWSLKTEIENFPTIKKPKEWFEETFFESVKLRMVSDVPVGVLLSGGLDSCSILSSLYHQNFKNINTFNIGFAEDEHNESFLAKKITEEYHYHFNNTQLNNDTLYQAISKLAKPKVKVLLSGEGADELMGGYVRYKALQSPSLLKVVSGLSLLEKFNKTPRFNKLLRYSKIDNPDDLVIFNGSNVYPEDIQTFYGRKEKPDNIYRYKILEEAKELYPNNPQRQALYFDQHTYMCSLLDRNDRCTMGTSIECREPFLDYKLVSGLGTLDDKWFFSGKKGKFILKDTMKTKLPEDIVNFRKIGLSAPWYSYLTEYPVFKEELDDFSSSPVFQMPFLENLDGKKLVSELRHGNSKLMPYIMPIFMLHIWYKNYFKKFV